jgi:folate-binding protein YgfZ
MRLSRSALHAISVPNGGFIERFGWKLPKAYTNFTTEYQAASDDVAVHDISYIGRLQTTGPDALDLINRLSTNEVGSLQAGQGAPTILTTDRGRIVDLIGVVNIGDHILLITSANARRTVIEWLDKYTIMENIVVEDVTSSTTMIAVVGPGSPALLESIGCNSLRTLPPYHTLFCNIAGHQVRVIRRFLGDLPSFDLLFPPNSASAVWQHLINSGVTPMGEEAYESVRVRYGVPLLEREMGESYNPLEAGLIGAIDFSKGCYIGQEVIARLDTYSKVQKYLAKLRFSRGLAIGEGTTLLHNDRTMGNVTSVTIIPTTGEIIGLGYVRKEAATVGIRLALDGITDGWAQIEELPQLFGSGQD